MESVFWACICCFLACDGTPKNGSGNDPRRFPTLEGFEWWDPKGGGPEGGDPKGGRREGWGARRVGARRLGASRVGGGFEGREPDGWEPEPRKSRGPKGGRPKEMTQTTRHEQRCRTRVTQHSQQ